MAVSKSDLTPLHKTLADVLLAKLKSDEVTASELAVAAKFLKDNDIVAVAGEEAGKQELEEALSRARRRKSLTPMDIEQAMQDVNRSMLQ